MFEDAANKNKSTSEYIVAKTDKNKEVDKMRIVKISAGMTGEFEVIKTNATDEVIKKQLVENNQLQEKGKNIDDPYKTIKKHGYKVDVLGCQDDIDLDEIFIDFEFDYYDFEVECMEEVKVYIDCLNADYRGDFVRCVDCGELMLIQIGGTACGECESKNLIFYDNNRPEWTVEELEKNGFIIIEK